MTRNRTTIELSDSNKTFWDKLPQGERKKLINSLFDELRVFHNTQFKNDSISVFLGRIQSKEIRLKR